MYENVYESLHEILYKNLYENLHENWPQSDKNIHFSRPVFLYDYLCVYFPGNYADFSNVGVLFPQLSLSLSLQNTYWITYKYACQGNFKKIPKLMLRNFNENIAIFNEKKFSHQSESWNRIVSPTPTPPF